MSALTENEYVEISEAIASILVSKKINIEEGAALMMGMILSNFSEANVPPEAVKGYFDNAAERYKKTHLR